MYDKCYFCLDQLPKLKKESTASFFVTFWRSRGTKEPAYITVHDDHTYHRVMTLTSEQDKMQTQLAAHFRPYSSAHCAYLTCRDKKVRYYDVSGQNRIVFDCFATKQCSHCQCLPHYCPLISLRQSLLGL